MNPTNSTTTSFFAETIQQDLALYKEVSYLPFLEKEPHIFEYTILGYIKSGSVDILLNNTRHTLKKGEMFCVIPDQKVQIIKRTTNFCTSYGIISHELLNHLVYRYPRFIFYFINLHPSFAVHPRFQKNIDQYSKLIFIKYNEKNNPFQKDILISLLQGFALDLFEVFYVEYPNINIRLSANEAIVEKFQLLFFKYIDQQKTLNYYAQQLGITTTHLNRVMKQEKGFGAKQYMTRILILETKQLLIYTPMSIKEISAKFNFTSPDSFHHFFKNSVGIPPNEYRIQNQANHKLEHKRSTIKKPLKDIINTYLLNHNKKM